jgi:hypothetical protein
MVVITLSSRRSKSVDTAQPAIEEEFVCYDAANRPGKRPVRRRYTAPYNPLPASQADGSLLLISRAVRVQTRENLETDLESDCEDS